MGGIKITPADSAFSKCVRARAGYKCQRCGAQHDKTSRGLHCSHHHRRGHWGIRFHPDNAESLCYGCHSLTGGTQDRIDEVMTHAQQDLLREKMNDIPLAKMYRKTKGRGGIAKHYRDELARIENKETTDFEAFY